MQHPGVLAAPAPACSPGSFGGERWVLSPCLGDTGHTSLARRARSPVSLHPLAPHAVPQPHVPRVGGGSGGCPR